MTVTWRTMPACRMAIGRHLAAPLAVETALVVCLWSFLASGTRAFSCLAYLPGYLVGLGLCATQGHWEHAAGLPTSHYGRIYNFLQAQRRLPRRASRQSPPFTGPACPTASRVRRSYQPLATGCSAGSTCRRWRLSNTSCCSRPACSASSCRVTEKPLLPLLAQLLKSIRRATIVGGGLFPRTALILRELLPAAHLTIVDCNPRNLETACAFLDGNIEYRTERYVPGESSDCDLTVIPLCLNGDRAAIYRHPSSPAVLVHDWIWRRRGTGAIVSLALSQAPSTWCGRTPIRGATEPLACRVESHFDACAPISAALLLVFLAAKMAMVW